MMKFNLLLKTEGEPWWIIHRWTDMKSRTTRNALIHPIGFSNGQKKIKSNMFPHEKLQLIIHCTVSSKNKSWSRIWQILFIRWSSPRDIKNVVARQEAPAHLDFRWTWKKMMKSNFLNRQLADNETRHQWIISPLRRDTKSRVVR